MSNFHRDPEMKDLLRSHIVRELMSGQERPGLENDTPLLKSGILDSLSLLKLVLFIEKNFSVRVEPEELIPENFASVDAICNFVSSKTGSKK